jgi:two-component sensor histidine kinase
MRQSPILKAVELFLAIAIPALLRWAADDRPYDAPFVTFFPAILLVAVFLGWRWAVAAALGSLIVIKFLFFSGVPPEHAPSSPALNLLVATGLITTMAIGNLLRQSIIRLEEHARRSDAFNLELQHRTKNSLQLVRGLASRASQATDPAEFYGKLSGRLEALAKANELLRFGAVESCRMAELIDGALAPFPSQQIGAAGPSCRIAKEAVVPLMMALHELGINATKHGSLSCETGRVDLSWSVVEDRIAVTWAESGGPEVPPPSARGLGARLLAANAGLQAVTVEFAPTGVVCRMEALRSVAPRPSRAPQGDRKKPLAKAG